MSIRPLLTRRKLVEIKRKALRRGVWFTALNKVERACIDITTKVVERVQSVFLAKVLTTIVKKLLYAMENKVERLMREVGYELALKISRIAQTWGYVSAFRWATDSKFIRYLAIIKMNTSATHQT
jgi:hypothetical protein